MGRSCRHARGRLVLVGAMAVSAAVGAAGCQYPPGVSVATGAPATSPGTTTDGDGALQDPSASPSLAEEATPSGPAKTTTLGSAGDDPASSPATGPGRPEPSQPSATTLLPGGAADGAAAPPAAAGPADLPLVPARSAWGELDTTAEAKEVAGRLQAFLAEVDKANARGSTDQTAVRDLSQGSARAEIENSLVEMELEGYRQRGATRLLGLSVHRMKPPVQRLVVVCVDDSEVEIVADNGYVVRPASKISRATLHEYTMLRVARDWRVLKHDMPDDPDCGPVR